MSDLPQVRLHEISTHGLRPVILECVSQGMKPGQISSYIEENHLLHVDERTIGHFLKNLSGDNQEVVQAGLMREYRDLQRMARQRLEHMLEEYEEAEEAGDLERMQFYEGNIKSWWSKNYQFFQDVGDVNIMFQQNDFSQTVNSLQVIADELQDEEPTTIVDMMDRIDGSD